MSDADPVRAAVKGVVERDGRVLLLKQDVTGDADYRWVLPGGGVEHGESFEAALRREVREETGLDVEVREAVGAYTFQFPSTATGETVHVCATVFACLAGENEDESEVDWSAEPDGEPIVDARWVNPEESRDLMLVDGVDPSLLQRNTRT